MIFFISISGCISYEVHNKVKADGSIYPCTISITTNQYVYGLWVANAQKEGYSSIKEQINSQNNNVFSYNEKWDGDSVTISLEALQPVISLDQSILNIQKEGEFLVVRDNRLMNDEYNDDYNSEDNPYTEAFLSGMSGHYYLEMPGDIVESNANVVDKNKAEWHLTGMDIFTTSFYAKSKLPTGIEKYWPILVLIVLFIVIIFGLKNRKKGNNLNYSTYNETNKSRKRKSSRKSNEPLNSNYQPQIRSNQYSDQHNSQYQTNIYSNQPVDPLNRTYQNYNNPQTPNQNVNSNSIKYCPYCGAKNNFSSNFCINCGNKLL